jgi:hypothetical protein
MIAGLAGRYDGRVLVVAAARPGSDLVTGLVKHAGPDLAGRVRRADADPGMDYPDRVELVRELLPDLPAQAAERVARRTATFGEVFAVVAADRVAGLGPGTGAGEAVAAADAVIDAVLDRAVPSREAAVLAWAGGALHQAQVEACLRVLGADRAEDDAHVRRPGPLACLADPASRRCAEQAAAFSARLRAGLAAAVLEGAQLVAADPGAGLADRVVARQGRTPGPHRPRSRLAWAARLRRGSVRSGGGSLPPLRLGGAERLPVVHDSGQQCAEQVTLLRIQRPQQGVGGAGKSCGSFPLRSLSFAGQVDEERAAVVRVAHPLHQSALLELVEQVDHRCPVDGQGRGQFDLGQRPGLGKRAEDPPAPGGQPQRLQLLGGQGLRRLRGHEQQLADPLGTPARAGGFAHIKSLP